MKTNERDLLELQLIEMRKRLLHEVDLADEARWDVMAKSGEFSTLPRHAADPDLEGLDGQVAISLNEQSLLEQVETAIERLQMGTYGVCQECECKIGMERLQAVPYTALCIACALKEHAQIKKRLFGDPRYRW
jgi:RNA polymerase-binding transcription factor DksA